MRKRASTRSMTCIGIGLRSARHWSAGPIGSATSSRHRPPTSGNSGWPPMRDPATTTDLGVKELTEIAIQYLCERELRELNDAINANFAISANFDFAFSVKFARETLRLGLRPPARKRGRPPQRRDRHVQIAGAVAMLVEDAGLHPTRSHASRRQDGPSACSIVTAALKQVGEYLGE